MVKVADGASRRAGAFRFQSTRSDCPLRAIRRSNGLEADRRATTPVPSKAATPANETAAPPAQSKAGRYFLTNAGIAEKAVACPFGTDAEMEAGLSIRP